MNIKSRGFVFSLDQEEKQFIKQIIDFVISIEDELCDSSAIVPDDLLAILTDLKDNARKLKENEFYSDGD